MNLRDTLRNAVEEGQKFLDVPTCHCIACHNEISRAAMNLIWYYDDPGAEPIEGGVAKMIGGGDKVVVQFPICEVCAPPCKKCQLPRRTDAVKRAEKNVSQKLGRQVSGFVGCRHTHLLGLVF
jgi:hypothetical protein